MSTDTRSEDAMTTTTPPTAVTAADAYRGLLLAHQVDGENVGIEVRHVEPCDDGRVLLVLAGGVTRTYPAGKRLLLVDEADVRAARERLKAREHRGRMIAALRALADLAEAGMPLPPYTLAVNGALDSVEEVTAAAVALGVEATSYTHDGRRYWSAKRILGCPDPADRYGNGVEVRLSAVEEPEVTR